jgi:hypothetical protein
MATLLALLPASAIAVAIAAVVYAMHKRRELQGLAHGAAHAWLAVDDLLSARRDAIVARLDAVSVDEANRDTCWLALTRRLTALDTARFAPDPLRIASLERQLRAQLANPQVREVIEPADRPLTPRSLAGFAADIDAQAEAYDVAASLFNLRLRRVPERWLARLDGLERLPAIELDRTSMSLRADWGRPAVDARIAPSSPPSNHDDEPVA